MSGIIGLRESRGSGVINKVTLIGGQASELDTTDSPQFTAVKTAGIKSSSGVASFDIAAGTGDMSFGIGNTDVKVKLPVASGIYKGASDTAVLTESSGTVTLDNVSLGGSVVSVAHEFMLIVAVSGGGPFHGGGGSFAGAGGSVVKSEQVGTNGIYTVTVGAAGGNSSVTKSGMVTITATAASSTSYNATVGNHGNGIFLKHLSGEARSATYVEVSTNQWTTGHGSGGPGAGGNPTGGSGSVSNGGNGFQIAEFVAPAASLGTWPNSSAYYGGGGGSGNHVVGSYTGHGSGTHGGGNGGEGGGSSGTNGTANTGGGAGGDGGAYGTSGGGGASVGGTGIVIVRIPEGIFTIAVTGGTNFIELDHNDYDYIFMKETGTFTLS